MIRIRDLSLSAGAFRLREISLEIASEEYFVLLGPTGSGKSLLLKCLCGLIRAEAGSIWIDGREVTHLEPRRRSIGYVPQDYGLFPHLSVERNILFSLRARGFSWSAARRQATPVIDTLELSPLLARDPTSLSGGERQKVALGRALAGRPQLLLLDEPVSALDAPTRLEVCAELQRVQRELRLPTIHVSHSAEEAEAISDRVGVLSGGRLVEAGPMLEILERPRSLAATRLLHDENVFEGTATPTSDSSSTITFVGGKIVASSRHEGPVWFLLRPERLRIQEVDEPSGIRVTLVEDSNRRTHRRLTFHAGLPMVVFVPAEAAERVVGREYRIEVPPEAVWVVPRP